MKVLKVLGCLTGLAIVAGMGFFIVYMFTNALSIADNPVPGEDEMQKAVEKIQPGQGTTGFGNCTEGEDVARDLSKALKAARKAYFTQANQPIPKGDFYIYCELHADRCGLIVQVPGLGNNKQYDADARKAQADQAWKESQKVLAKKFKAEDLKLGIVLRAGKVYGPTMVGKQKGGEDPPDSSEDSADAYKKVAEFFIQDTPAGPPATQPSTGPSTKPKETDPETKPEKPVTSAKATEMEKKNKTKNKKKK